MVKQQKSKQKQSKQNKKAIGFWRNWKLPLKIGLGLVALVALFFVYSYFNYGSFNGYFLDHKAFPGAESNDLSGPRNELFGKELSIRSVVEGLSTKPIYTSELSTTDICIKGVNQLPVAGSKNDGFAYSCEMKISRVYVFNEPQCEVMNAMMKSQAFNAGTCTAASARNTVYTKNRGRPYGGPLGIIGVEDIGVLKAEGRTNEVFTFANECANPLGKVQVYCKQTGSQTPISLSVLGGSAKTLVSINLDDTYYQK